MFLPNSRYAKVATVTTRLATGEEVVALKLRKLTPVAGEPRTVMSGDRLDLFAQQGYGDATQFWHVADANTALDSRELTAVPGDDPFIGGFDATLGQLGHQIVVGHAARGQVAAGARDAGKASRHRWCLKS